MTREELIEQLQRAICDADGTCALRCSSPTCAAYHGQAEAALTAIEAVIPVSRILSGECVVVPVEPTRGKLVSMALRYTHDFLISKHLCGGHTPAERDGILSSMSQLHEEVVGSGFYQPEKEADYVSRMDKAK